MDIARKRNRTRFKLKMLSKLPRVSVNKSNKYFSAQLIDVHADGKVLSSIHQKTFKGVKKSESPLESVTKMGESFGAEIMKLGIKKIAYDRSGYIYHGKVKAFAEGLRKAGLIL